MRIFTLGKILYFDVFLLKQQLSPIIYLYINKSPNTINSDTLFLMSIKNTFLNNHQLTDD